MILGHQPAVSILLQQRHETSGATSGYHLARAGAGLIAIAAHQLCCKMLMGMACTDGFFGAHNWAQPCKNEWEKNRR